MPKFKCEYCSKTFSTKGNLDIHIKNAQYCIKNRDGTMSTHTCQYCRSILATKHSLSRHENKCPDKKVLEIEKKFKHDLKNKREKIKELESNIKKLEKHNKKLDESNRELVKELDEHKGIITGMKNAPDKKTIYNTAYVHPKLINLPINNIPALTQEYMIEKVNDGILTYEKAARGYPGILEVIGEMITHENEFGEIERNYVCTDVSRNSFHRLLESKKWKSDKGGRYLNNMLDTFRDVMEEYKDKVYDLYNETPHESIEWSQVDWERKNISLLYSGVVCREGTSDREELVNILRKEISKRASV